MAELTNKFNLGDIVTFKTHPLFNSLRIKGDGKNVPPIMMIKEVHFENQKKKTFDPETGKEIGERIKYCCTYFDDNRQEFKDVFLYQKMLRTFADLKIERINKDGTSNKNYEELITEVQNYTIPSYEFGKIVNFKTIKLEIYKKRTSKRISLKEDTAETKKIKEVLQYVVNYATPDFVISGFKRDTPKNLFYNNGKPKLMAPTDFLKVQWFNPVQQKFSEQYLPIDFFTDKIPLNKEEQDIHELIDEEESKAPLN